MQLMNSVSKTLFLASALLCASVGHAANLAQTASVSMYYDAGSGAEPGATGPVTTWTHGDEGIFSSSFNYGSATSGVAISYHGDEYWDFQFAAPSYNKANNTNDGQILTKGFYDKATRFPFNSPTRPGLNVSGGGWGNNTLYGYFNVREITYNATTGEVDKFAVDFRQYNGASGPSGPSLIGSLRFNSAIPLSPVPEADSYAMFIAAFGVMGLLARRRKSQKA